MDKMFIFVMGVVIGWMIRELFWFCWDLVKMIGRVCGKIDVGISRLVVMDGSGNIITINNVKRIEYD